jgi:hypothetical protein
MPIGPAMFFVLSLVASVIIGLIVVTYAARTFMNGLNGTAAGNDDIPWPTDPYIDQLADPFFLAYLMALGSVAALVPVGLLFPDFLDHPAGVPIVIGGVAWLVFPILLLSALTGTSRWYILHWECLRRLARHPLAVLVFYLSTGASLLIGGGAAILALYHPHPLALLAVLVTAACVFIHARLFGRLAWLVGRTPIHKKSARRRLRGVKAADPWQIPDAPEERDDVFPATKQETAFTAADPRPVINQPAAAPAGTDAGEEDEWAPNKKPYEFRAYTPDPVTDEPARAPAGGDAEEDEWTPNKKPYALERDPAAHAPPKTQSSNPHREAITASPRARGDDEGEENPDMLPAPPELPAETAGQFKHELPKPDRIELRWQEGRKLPPLPKWPLLGGVWTFPFYQTTLPRLVALFIWSLVMALMLRLMLSLAQGEIRGAL